MQQKDNVVEDVVLKCSTRVVPFSDLKMFYGVVLFSDLVYEK